MANLEMKREIHKTENQSNAFTKAQSTATGSMHFIRGKAYDDYDEDGMVNRNSSMMLVNNSRDSIDSGYGNTDTLRDSTASPMARSFVKKNPRQPQPVKSDDKNRKNATSMKAIRSINRNKE